MSKLLKLELENIEEITEDNIEEQKERFKIKDLEQANWALRKLAALNQKEKEIEQLAKAEIDRIKEWEKKEKEEFSRDKSFFEFLLEEYFREGKAKDDKFKIKTPYGAVSSRKQQPKWNYEDDKVLDWLKKNDTELIRIKEEINKAELKKKYAVSGDLVVDSNGEIVKGIEIEHREPTITIKVVDE